MLVLDPEVSAKIRTMQVFDDAIAYRKDRLCLPCQDCGPDRSCIEHSYDQSLVRFYQGVHAASFRDLIAGIIPGDPEPVIEPDSDTPPLTAVALSLVLLAQFRKQAAEGPVAVQFDDKPFVIELDGDVLVERPFQPDTDTGPEGCADETQGVSSNP